ncbi:MAG: hypothetical protein COB38_02745 [Gammaproteobacteria bacterium]|nr:MAG: hypothetical protein COB38_02745 [Gammaproteobacteria bacterium]
MKNSLFYKKNIRLFIQLVLLSLLGLIKPSIADVHATDNSNKKTLSAVAISPSANDAIAVTVVNVKQERRNQIIKNSGRISYKNEMHLSFKTPGLLKQIKVEEGDEVIKGQILAMLDLEEIDAQQKRAASNFNKVSADLNRFIKLYDDDLVSLQVKQNAQSAFDAAQAELQIANFNKKLSVIRAPVNGRILKRYVESNELLQSGQSVFLLASHKQGTVVRIGLIDQDIVKVAINDSAIITLDAYPGKIFDGKVSEVALSTDSASGTFEVEVLIESNQLRLRSGLIARVEITPASSELQFYIPIESVFKADNGMATVFLLDEEKNLARAIEVKIITFLLNEVSVIGELKPTDKVIKLGVPYLFDGRQVRVVNDSSIIRK